MSDDTPNASPFAKTSKPEQPDLPTQEEIYQDYEICKAQHVLQKQAGKFGTWICCRCEKFYSIQSGNITSGKVVGSVRMMYCGF